MAVVPIRIVGDPVLHTPTAPVPVAADGSLPADLADLITNLYDTMDAAYGVGLAANQIGVGLRVFVYDCADERGQSERRRGVVVNPVLETSEVPETMPDPDDDDEGCLSVPGESFPNRAGSVGQGHRTRRRRHRDKHRGLRVVRTHAPT
jgi:peptide deformylase